MSQRPPSFDLATVRWIALGSMLLGASSTLLLGLRFSPDDERREPSAEATPTSLAETGQAETGSSGDAIAFNAKAFRIAIPQFHSETSSSETSSAELRVPTEPPPREMALSEEPPSLSSRRDRSKSSNPDFRAGGVSTPTPKPRAIAENTDESTVDTSPSDSSPDSSPSETSPSDAIAPTPESIDNWSLPEFPGERLELELSDVVVLALQNNRDIENAYLERLLSFQELASAEDKFVPNFTPEVRVTVDRDWFEERSTNQDTLQLNAQVEVLLPTGASFEASIGSASQPGFDARGSDFFPVDRVDQNVEVRFVQPLLQGAGTTVNRASVEIARLEDRSAYLALKATLINTITQAIEAYRRLLQAQERLKIQELALEKAQRQVEVTQALIEGGRLAPVELVTSQTQVANREVSVVEAKNALGQAQLNLLRVLDIDREAVPIAVQSPSIPEFDGDRWQVDRLLNVALQNNPDYLQLRLQFEQTRLNLLLAEDERRWQLNFDARYRQGLEGFRDTNGEWTAALILQRSFFGNDRLDLAVARQETRLETLQNQIANFEDNLRIDVQNAVRDLEAKFRQVELARRARELAQQQLENEREKIQLGVGNLRLLDLVNLEDDLVEAENRELNAAIIYLDAQTTLEQLLGVTLERWNLELEIDSEDASFGVSDTEAE
ncbi:TolC family protein [Baaleninema sp.]|uniref:TolC family protein n=1 Tax=Baaleninema sp. TaxID=3101197 RepID=UPI003CFF8260